MEKLIVGVKYPFPPRCGCSYVRYGGEFLVGMSGTSTFCETCEKEVKRALGRMREVLLREAKICFQQQNCQAKFCDVLISFNYTRVLTPHPFRNSVEVKKKCTKGVVSFRAPVIDVKNKLRAYGYCYAGCNEKAKACL